MPKNNKIGQRIVQAYGLIYVALFLYGLLDWQGFISSELTTIPMVMQAMFGAWAQLATLALASLIAYGLLTTQWWTKYLYLLVFVTVTFWPPWEYVLGDIISIFFDQFILYLMFLNPSTKTMFKDD